MPEIKIIRMKKLVITGFVAMATVIFSCKKAENKDKRAIDKASWLLGEWENKSDDGVLTENWEQSNDSLYKAVSYYVYNKDTLHSEQISLFQNGSEMIYSPVVKGENTGKPVDFKLTKITATELVFENAANDYPKKIVYRKITEDSLQLSISGLLKGRPGSENYPFSRIKETEK